MKKVPFFSIVIIHYEGSVSKQEAVRCLLSFYNQRFRDFEILFLHDGPRERPWESDEFPVPVDIPLQNIQTQQRMNDYGHSLRDAGINIARGRYVLITNADNYHYPDMLQMLYDEAVKKYTPILINDIDRKAADILVFGILAKGYISAGDGIVDLRKRRPDLAEHQWLYMSGYPTIFRNIDCMQFVMRRDLWLKEGGWFRREMGADGLLFQEFVKRYGVRYIIGPLGEHH